MDMSFYIPTSNDFSWVGRWHHDFTNNRELEVFSGFEYNNCCWRAGVVIRRWLDRRNETLELASQELNLGMVYFCKYSLKALQEPVGAWPQF